MWHGHAQVSGQPTIIDLFCGAGGLGSSLERAGFATVAAVDRDKDCVATLEACRRRRLRVPRSNGREYLAETRLICADVVEIGAVDLRPKGASRRWRPDVLVGGPPCQPFSSAGKQRGLSDPRGQLFLEFVRLADELRPRFILFENVRGLLTARTPDGRPGGVLELVQRSFEDIGYACRIAVLNAADYGAPQRRVRLFIFATRDRVLPEFPTPTHAKEPKLGLFEQQQPWATLAEFLAQQPPPKSEDIVWASGERAKELAQLKAGTGLKSGGIVEHQRPGGHWGYKQDCFVADPSMPSRTIRAATTPDWLRQSGGRLRRLTWRECSALQGFPSSWEFVGTQASRFRQIGNAVQGDLGEILGRGLATAVAGNRRAKPKSAPWPEEFYRRVRNVQMEERCNGAHRAAARRGEPLPHRRSDSLTAQRSG